MRSCTPGNERALSVKTVPRIKKSFAWLYFFLAGLPGVAAGACGAAAELGGGCTASWTCPNAAPKEATSPAVERIAIHRAKCTFLLLTDLDGGTSTAGCQAGGTYLLLLVFFFVVVIIIVDEVAIFTGLAFIFLVVLFVRIIGDEV